MKRNILVIGGSYFIGRAFVEQMSGIGGFSVHILNRGRIPLGVPGITEYKCNRRELNALKKTLPKLTWDAVIDFSAKFPNDCAAFLENLPGRARQYIFTSSYRVYEHSNEFPKTEDSRLLTAQGPGILGEYAFNKRLLEDEAKNVCAAKNIPLTILRPAYVYGPGNYLFGENYYFDLLLSGKPVPAPSDSISLFQFVYVRDVAWIISKCIGKPEVFGNTYNLAAPELVCYDRLMDVLAGFHNRELETEMMSVQEIEESNIHLPFPLRRHELYRGDKIARTLGFSYTPFAQGMMESYHYYRKNLDSEKQRMQCIHEILRIHFPDISNF